MDADRNDFLISANRIIYAVKAYIITPDIERREVVDELVNMTQNLWIQAFTDESRSTINYENLEHLGDLQSKALLGELIHKEFPRMTAQQASQMIGYYASNAVQGAKLDSLTDQIPDIWDTVHNVPVSFKQGRLSELALVDKTIYAHQIPVSIRDDLYESIFAAMYITGNVGVPELGHVWCMKFINKLYKGRLSLEEAAADDPIGVLNQIFVRFQYTGTGVNIEPPRLKMIGEGAEHGEGIHSDRTFFEYHIPIKERQRLFFKSPFIIDHVEPQFRENFANIPKSLGIGRDYTRTGAQKEAARMAIETLRRDFGITDEWAERHKYIYDGMFMNMQRIGLKVITGYIPPTPQRPVEDVRDVAANMEYSPSMTQFDIDAEALRFTNRRPGELFSLESRQMGLYDAFQLKITLDGYINFEVIKPGGKTMTGNRTVLYLNATRRSNGEYERLKTEIGDGNTFKVNKDLYLSYLKDRIYEV